MAADSTSSLPFSLSNFYAAASPRRLLALAFAVAYALSSAGEVLALRSLVRMPLRAPAFTAMLSNQMWLLMMPTWLLMLNRGNDPSPLPQPSAEAGTPPPPAKAGAPSPTPLAILGHYTLFGVLTFAITVLRNEAIADLPGSVFSLLISTSIIFNMAISWAVLRKPFNLFHAAAALCCLASAMSISGAALFTTEEDPPAAEEVNYVRGVPLALCAAFFVAVMGVAQEVVQPLWAGPLFDRRMVEMALASSLIASALIVIYGAALDELRFWEPKLRRASAAADGAQDQMRVAQLAGVLAVLPILKLVVRNTKYSIINLSNAFFFEFVQASSALLAALASVLAFNERWGPGFVVSMVLLAAAFAFYTKAKALAKGVAKAPKAAPPQDGKALFEVVAGAGTGPTSVENVALGIAAWK